MRILTYCLIGLTIGTALSFVWELLWSDFDRDEGCFTNTKKIKNYGPHLHDNDYKKEDD